MNEQSHVMSKGLHIVVATPGRLIDMLEKKRFTFNSCKYLCMDEADRMIDLGFEDDVRNIMSFFKVSRLLSGFGRRLKPVCSAKGKPCYSPRRCLEKFKNLHRSH